MLYYVDITNQDCTKNMHKKGTGKSLRQAFQLPATMPPTEFSAHVQREVNKSLVQKMTLQK
jgi:hypothetical protein